MELGITDPDLEECCLGADCPAAGDEILIGDGGDRRRALTTERRLSLGGKAVLAAGMETTLASTPLGIFLPWCNGTFPCLFGILFTPTGVYLFICLSPRVMVVICLTNYDVVIVFVGNIGFNLDPRELKRCGMPLVTKCRECDLSYLSVLRSFSAPGQTSGDSLMEFLCCRVSVTALFSYHIFARS